MEEPVPPHSAVRVGYVDYGYPEIPSGELDFATSPFSPFQKRLLLALTNQEGLLFDIVGAAEVSAFASFLENQQEHERLNKSQNDYEFGNSKKTEAEKYEDFDLRMLFDADAWNACEYEFHVVLSAWDYETISTGTTWDNQYWTLDYLVESADVTLSLVEIESGQVLYSVFYKMRGDDLQERFDEVAVDFTQRLEITLWKKWIKR